MTEKIRAQNNRTLTVTETERSYYNEKILSLEKEKILSVESLIDKTLCADLFSVIDFLPEKFADLLIIDPPYNLAKNYNGFKFSKTDDTSYIDYLESWLPKILKTAKETASIYICCDWKCTSAIYSVMKKYCIIQNRITWQREKGRGSKTNWKNSCEDIWFGTMSSNYYFDVDSVMQKRKVIAPYKENGKPKDWQETDEGKFRMTHPGNFWDDISVPYWSMPENTDHPTQKPEKLIAKLILASCPKNGIVLDPFLGSGTTSVTAKKLNRHYFGIEQNREYCIWAEKRLEHAEHNKKIQGYSDGVFWERNTKIEKTKEKQNF